MSIYRRFMTPDRQCRSFLRFLAVFFVFFYVFSTKTLANGTEESRLIYTGNIYHKHTGSAGAGCYTVKRMETKNEKCDGGGMCSNGPHGPDTSGQVYYVGSCTKCGGRLHRYGSSGYDSCGSMKTVTYTYYDLGCGQSSSTILGTVSVELSTSEWTKEVILTCSYGTNGNMTVTEMPYIWNGEEATAQDSYLVTQNGDYTFQLNADSNADTENSIIVIPVRNIDTTAPVVASYALEPENGWVREGVLLTLGETQDLQPDNTQGCGLHEKAFSYDNGQTWTTDTSYFYKENGVYTVMVRDQLENVSSFKISFDNVDNYEPTIESVEYDDTPNVLSTTLTVTASDVQADGSHGCGLHEMPYSFDGGNTWTDNPVYETDRNGTITVAVRDTLENIAYRDVVISNIDGCGPAVSYRMSPDSWTNQDVTLYLSAQDRNADGSEGVGLPDAWYSLDGGNTWDSKEELVFSQNRELALVARDKYGNLTYMDIFINCIDKDAPGVSLEMEVSGDGEEKSVTLVARGEDYGSGLHDQPYSWDNGGYYGNENKLTVMQNGTYEVIVRDKAGNRQHEQIEVTVFEEPIEEIIPVIAVVEPAPEEESVLQEEEEAEPETEIEPVVIKAVPKADKPAAKPVQTIEEDVWDIKDTLVVAGVSAVGLGTVVLLGFYLLNSIAVYVEDEEETMLYLSRLWIHHKEECYEVRITEALLEKCVTTHFYLRPSLLFRIKHKGVTLSVLFPEDICIAIPVSKEMDFSLL